MSAYHLPVDEQSVRDLLEPMVTTVPEGAPEYVSTAGRTLMREGGVTIVSLETRRVVASVVDGDEAYDVELASMLVEYLVRQASRYGMQPDQFVQQVVQSGQTGSFVSEVVRGKALAHVLEQATVTDASGRPVDLKALTADPAGAEGDSEGDSGGTDESTSDES